MASVMEILVKAEDMASSVFEQIGEAGASAGDFISNNWGKITAVTAGAGAAAEGFARKQADTNAVIGRAAHITDGTEESLRAMIAAMTDHTFTAEDAARGMERLIKSGVTTQEEFETILPLMDQFADATGKDMVASIDGFDRVLSALGIPMTEVGDHLDTMTFLSTQTTVEMRSLGQLMRREAGPMKEMGLSVDDVAVAMAALEAEGRKGPRAVMGFQDALKEAEGDVDAFWEALGVANENLEEQQRRVAESAGLTEEFANINNATITPLERLQRNMSNLGAEYGHLAFAAGNIAPAFMAVGPLSRGVVAGFRGVATGARLAGTAFQTMSRIFMTNPFVIIAVAVVAIAVLIYKYWDEITEFFKKVWDFIVGMAEKLFGTEFFGVIKDVMESVRDFIVNAWETIRDFFTDIWDRITEMASTVFGNLRDFFSQIFEVIFNIVTTPFVRVFNFYRRIFERIWEIVKVVWNGVKNFFSDTFTAIWDTIRNVWETITGFLSGVFDDLRDMASRRFEAFREAIVTIFEQIRDRLRNIWNGILDIIRGVINRIIGLVNNFIDRVNRISVTIPDFPGVPGRGQTVGFNIPRIPTLHTGGRFFAPSPGGEGLALLRDGETVLRHGQTTGRRAGPDPIEKKLDELIDAMKNHSHSIVVGERQLARAVRDAFREEARISGPVSFGL